MRILEEDPVVSSVHDVKAIIIGSSNGRFKAEINFDGEVSGNIANDEQKRTELDAALRPHLEIKLA